MHANTVWGFIGLGAGLLFLIAPEIWPVGQWKALYFWVAMTCFAVALATLLWPRIFGNRSPDNQAAAAQAHVEELRRSTDNQRYIADPAIQAFTEQRRRDIEAGLATEEMPLGMATHWIATRLAWARWQTAQHHSEVGSPQILRITLGYMLSLLQEGQIPTRGHRDGDPNRLEFISPNWVGQLPIRTGLRSDPTLKSGNCFVKRLRESNGNAGATGSIAQS